MAGNLVSKRPKSSPYHRVHGGLFPYGSSDEHDQGDESWEAASVGGGAKDNGAIVGRVGAAIAAGLADRRRGGEGTYR
uniref:DUF834 domain-containing protein n=1 Tax=Oryza punctata TaxID=4537 RepID=A0A0E0MKU5_ORYPU